MSKFPPKTKKPESAYIIKPPVKHNWSEFQKDIFRDISKGSGHTVIIARAGSAKSTSLIEGSRYVPAGKRSLFCAFNKSIQEELKSKLSDRCECLTLHSLGFRAIKQKFGKVELDENKCWKIVTAFFDDEKGKFDLINNIVRAVELCKATLTDVPSKIEELLIKYDIDLCEETVEQFTKYIIQTLRICKEQTSVIDFNDMVWLCFVYKLNPGKYDFVFLDEAHDCHRAQIELALSACKPDGRVIAVLDDRQAIYSWRGADAEVLENFKKRLNPKILTLPICYRCPKKVVWLAQTIVPDIQMFDNAIDGEIINLHMNDLIKTAKPGDYVISRTNAPLIKHCLQFLKKGIPSNILGRDIGNNLSYIVKKSKRKTVEAFLKWLEKWEETEKANLIAKYPKAGTDTITDKVDCLKILCDDAKTIEEVNSNIKNLFKDNDEKKIVLFSSIHRSKGKESNNVFILKDTLRGGTLEEDNIRYVATTRAKQKLYLVSKIDLKDDFTSNNLENDFYSGRAINGLKADYYELDKERDLGDNTFGNLTTNTKMENYLSDNFDAESVDDFIPFLG